MTGAIRVLHIEGDYADARLFQEYLDESMRDFHTEVARRLADGIDRLAKESFDIVLMDLGLPDAQGIESFKRVHDVVPGVPIIVLSGLRDEKLAKRAVHEGAQDYLIKGDINPRALARALDYAMERKHSERRILDLNRLLRSTQHISHLIIREKDEGALLREACNILHTVAGFSIVWIGLVDESSPRIVPAAAAGLEIDFLQRFTITRDGKPTGRGPSGRVFGSKKTCLFTNLKNKDFDPWRDTIESLGITSCVASPLMIDNVVFGILNVYSQETDSLKDEAVALIEEVAGDLSLAVSTIRMAHDRERMAEALLEGEERYRTLIDNLNDAIFNVDAEGRITYFSPIVTQMSGYAPEEIVGRHFTDFLDEHEATIVSGCLEDLLSGRAALFEIELKDKSGNDRCYRISSRLQYRAGDVVGISGVMSDITETRRAQEALRDQAEILDQIHDIVITTDLEGTITSWSKGAERQIGYRAEEMLGKPVSLVYPEREYESTRSRTIEALRGNGEIRDEFTVKRKDGSEFPVHLTLTLRRNKDGKTTGIIGSAVDISERKEAEKALRESESRYRLLAENANDVIFTIDTNLKTTYASPSVMKLRGLTADEAMAQTPAEALTPASLETALNAFREELEIEARPDSKPDRTRVLELEETCKDGSTIWTETTFSFLRDTQGVLTGFLGITRDISQRKRAEEALKISEEKYRAVVENGNEAIVIAQDDMLKFVNPQTERLSGYSKEELLGRPFTEFIHPEDRSALIRRYQERLDGKPARHPAQFRVNHKNGDLRWAQTGVVTIDWEGRPATLVFAHDITEQKRAEEALRESEERFRTLFESSMDAILIVTAAGRIVAINSAGRELFGYTQEEMASVDALAFYADPDDRDRFRRLIEAQGYTKDFEITYRKKDGTLVECLETATIVRDTDGRVVGYQGTIRDVTEHKKMEQRLIQAQKLSSLGGMISGVAHELNNPLTSIIGNAQLLMRKEIPPDFRNKLEVIQRESVRCTRIVGGLLSFAREHRPERRMIDVNSVLIESLRLREYDLKVNNVQVDTDLAGDLPETSADPYQLQQVFINLINNSHDALREKEGGTLSIRSLFKDGFIRVVFADDGPGIEPDNLNRIFDPFFTTKDVGKGTGLGLSIAYGIINEHGGTIDVESRRGKGTRFTVRIPLARQSDPTAGDEVGPSSKKPVRNRAILIVEDEESLRKLISEALVEEGYRVRSVSRGEQAIELLKVLRFDLIITDLKMPGVGGKELYTYIRKHVPDLADRVLFMTGDVLAKDTLHFLEIAGNPFLEKPFDLTQLFQMISDLLSKRD